jgi:peptidoglycan/xylan/chitin deacetylase (PgdA/CDA1 family)
MHPVLKGILRPLLQPIVRFRGDRGSIYLTFDDGPHPERTAVALAALGRAGAVATFFMNGAEAEKHPHLARRVAEAGHAVGYHSHRHPHMRGMSGAEQREELRDIARLERLLDRRVRLYRPPYGELTLAQVSWCLARGVRVVMWSLDTGDSFADDAGDWARRTASALRGGDIVLLHDDTAVAIEGLPVILEGVRRAGLSFGRL